MEEKCQEASEHWGYTLPDQGKARGSDGIQIQTLYLLYSRTE